MTTHARPQASPLRIGVPRSPPTLARVVWTRFPRLDSAVLTDNHETRRVDPDRPFGEDHAPLDLDACSPQASQAVSGSTAKAVAVRAGVDVQYVERLAQQGILAPRDGMYAANDSRRVGVVQALEHAGLALDSIGEAIRRGEMSLDFVDQPDYERFAALTDETFRQVATRTNVPLDLLLVIREAMGFAQPSADDRVRADEMDVVPLVALQCAHGFRPIVIERWIRTYGDSMGRIADTEADWYRTEVLGPLFSAGKGAAEVVETTGAIGAQLSELGDRAVLGLFHGRQANAWIKNILDGFETSLTRAGLQDAVDKPPAICFLDLTGYTRLTEERGDEAAAELAGRLARLVQRTSAQHGGKPVKWLGDGVMFYFREPGRGVLAALEMVEGASEAELPPAHVGLHAGPVLFQEGDYFGRTVNLASRIADYARQGEVVVSQEVVDAGGADGVAFAAIGPVELKGASTALTLHVARRATGQTT
jgi:adenylate cyclase